MSYGRGEWRITTAICSALLKFGGGAEFGAFPSMKAKNHPHKTAPASAARGEPVKPVPRLRCGGRQIRDCGVIGLEGKKRRDRVKIAKVRGP
jgi:hypothetical protein